MAAQATVDGRDPEAWHRLKQKLERLSGSVKVLATWESLDELRDSLELSRRMKDHPYATLAMAAGAGYLLGGGLFSGATRRLAGAGLLAGLRLAAIPILQAQLDRIFSGLAPRTTTTHEGGGMRGQTP